MSLRRVLRLAALALLLGARSSSASAQPSLDAFIGQVAQLWAAGEASALVDLAPRDGRLVVDLGREGGGSVEGRHAAAALRDLFGRRHHVSIRATQVAVSGGSPPRGFGELTWASRQRGVREADRSVVYVGAELEGGAWRIRELRLIR